MSITWSLGEPAATGGPHLPSSATSNWNETLAVNTGVAGSATLSATGTDALAIGDDRIVLVQEPGG